MQSINAQHRSGISGYVKNADGPIADATVIIRGTERGTVTNKKGYFELSRVGQSKVTIVVSYSGYLTQTQEVLPGASKLLEFTLAKDERQLQDVTVTAVNKAREVKHSGFSVNVVETKQFANTTADINQVLNLTTGIRIREQGGLGSNFNFSINGLSGKSVKYFIDGVPVEVLGSAMSLNNIPVNLSERIEAYKGVVPVHLGSDAMGGAINIITSQKQTNYIDASYSYGSFNTHRASFTGQYTHQKTGIQVKGTAFYNYSGNNYTMKDVEILEGGVRHGNEITDLNGAVFVRTDAKRFHDRYQSAMGQIEIGLAEKKWADALFLGVGYSQGMQDLQTGFEQTIVYGNVTRKSSALSGSLRYKKDNLFVHGLSLNIFASQSRDSYLTADTLYRQYYWDGTWTVKSSSEMNSIKSLSRMSRPKTFARANLSYAINEQHSVNFNYTIDRVKNENYNELVTSEDPQPGLLNKQIAGLAYQQELLDKRWVNTFFGKYYGLNLTANKWINNEYTAISQSQPNYGYGIATRYKILPEWGVKASYEKAFRLQEVDEVFGDGLNVQPNPDLKPEHSNNFNVGMYYGKTLRERHRFYIEASGFYRNAADFIYPVPDQRSKALKNENKSSVRITGMEAELRYDYMNLLSFNVNLTYQNAVNTTKFGGTTSSTPEATYLNKIPNQPWLFGNAGLSIGKNDLLGKDTRLQFNWYTQYVHWFYLTWEAYGNANGKSDIPNQLVHNATLTYSLQNGKYNISAECRNLSDNPAFDNFRLQKPGRAFSMKFRYFLR
ncbi:TonB-dependent receptor [Agriterribacter sp.]|uniref:TonB-dependent receptor n=1 Tax=Agriterribacter sp. TaxID=2821509 RepID=UPI002CAA72A0|nr:TonB-dependent receptor [Agriterribacter sp.]HRP54572.1 TonB-dependent receptor [Agriterribacter sp.]